MDRLTPIPSPPGHLLREFLHRAFPIITFVIAAGALGLVWNKRFVGTMLFGEVEALRSDVVSVQSGSISALYVRRFDTVTNGQILATVETMTPEIANRALDVLRAEIQILRSRMTLNEARNDQNVEDVRIRSLEARVNLATAKISVETARRDLERANQLFADRIISEADLDHSRRVHDALEAQVRERETLAEGLLKSITGLTETDQKNRVESIEVLNQSLAAQEKKLQESRIITLRASMAGMIKILTHRVGENIPAGTVVTSITALQSEHIVGFVRQPLMLDPRPGMAVEIRTRGPRRQVASSIIRSVGSELENAATPLRLRGVDPAIERGLAFFVDLPPGLDVHPGELVDLVVRPAASKARN